MTDFPGAFEVRRDDGEVVRVSDAGAACLAILAARVLAGSPPPTIRELGKLRGVASVHAVSDVLGALARDTDDPDRDARRIAHWTDGSVSGGGVTGRRARALRLLCDPRATLDALLRQGVERCLTDAAWALCRDRTLGAQPHVRDRVVTAAGVALRCVWGGFGAAAPAATDGVSRC